MRVPQKQNTEKNERLVYCWLHYRYNVGKFVQMSAY